MNSKVLFAFTFLILGIVAYSLMQNKPDARSLPQVEPVVNEKISTIASEEELMKEAYDQGYKRGQNAFLVQTNHPLASSFETKESYTVFVELNEEQKEAYKEAATQGYVDGYHKASDLVQCPRMNQR